MHCVWWLSCFVPLLASLSLFAWLSRGRSISITLVNSWGLFILSISISTLRGHLHEYLSGLLKVPCLFTKWSLARWKPLLIGWWLSLSSRFVASVGLLHFTNTLCGNFSCFIPNHQLHEATTSVLDFQWSSIVVRVFDRIKCNIIEAPVLHPSKIWEGILSEWQHFQHWYWWSS